MQVKYKIEITPIEEENDNDQTKTDIENIKKIFLENFQNISQDLRDLATIKYYNYKYWTPLLTKKITWTDSKNYSTLKKKH